MLAGRTAFREEEVEVVCCFPERPTWGKETLGRSHRDHGEDGVGRRFAPANSSDSLEAAQRQIKTFSAQH